MTSHVCSVASGAKETRRFAKVFRRAACRSFFSCSVERIGLVAGTNADFRLFFASCLSNLGASCSSNPPGPILLLRPFRGTFFGDELAFLECSGSLDVSGTTFSLFSGVAIVANLGPMAVIFNVVLVLETRSSCEAGRTIPVNNQNKRHGAFPSAPEAAAPSSSHTAKNRKPNSSTPHTDDHIIYAAGSNTIPLLANSTDCSTPQSWPPN